MHTENGMHVLPTHSLHIVYDMQRVSDDGQRMRDKSVHLILDVHQQVTHASAIMP